VGREPNSEGNLFWRAHRLTTTSPRSRPFRPANSPRGCERVRTSVCAPRRGWQALRAIRTGCGRLALLRGAARDGARWAQSAQAGRVFRLGPRDRRTNEIARGENEASSGGRLFQGLKLRQQAEQRLRDPVNKVFLYSTGVGSSKRDSTPHPTFARPRFQPIGAASFPGSPGSLQRPRWPG
jgi:hypothetical protein